MQDPLSQALTTRAFRAERRRLSFYPRCRACPLISRFPDFLFLWEHPREIFTHPALSCTHSTKREGQRRHDGSRSLKSCVACARLRSSFSLGGILSDQATPPSCPNLRRSVPVEHCVSRREYDAATSFPSGALLHLFCFCFCFCFCFYFHFYVYCYLLLSSPLNLNSGFYSSHSRASRRNHLFALACNHQAPPCRTIRDSSTTTAMVVHHHRSSSNTARLPHKDIRRPSKTTALRECAETDEACRASADCKQTSAARIQPAATVQQLWRTVRTADSSATAVWIQPGAYSRGPSIIRVGPFARAGCSS
jgi:hypothetical protein